MDMRRVALVTAVVLAISAAPVVAQDGEAFTDVGFVVSVNEPSDSPPQPVGALDIKEIALGEPGDDTVVLRATLAGAPSGPTANSRLYFGFSTAAGDVVGGCGYNGAPQTRNIGEAIAPDACLVSGAVVYATYNYGTIEENVGSTITKIWGFTDGCAQSNNGCLPGDTAPGGIANQGWPATTFGADYTLSGCTRSAGCGGGASAAPLELLEGETIIVHLAETNMTSTARTYAWNTTLEAAEARLNLTGNGSVALRILDGNGTVVVNKTVAAPNNRTFPIESAAPGNWSVSLTLSNFTGSVDFLLGPMPEDQTSSGNSTTSSGTKSAGSASSSSNDDDRTGTFPLRHEEQTPGLGPVALLALVAFAGLVARRRLR
ncbi:MAG TPA: hypothetical protein VM327_10625 [Candidatus Thermoplasmatota archaeon]|nr:hypothetical protein [Candidatus Thermoplasmatota archaeon]